MREYQLIQNTSGWMVRAKTDHRGFSNLSWFYNSEAAALEYVLRLEHWVDEGELDEHLKPTDPMEAV